MSRRGAGLLLPLAAVLLAGCGTDPGGVRRVQVAEVTEAANARDADLVRSRADALVETLAAQVADKQLAADEAERLTALARAVRAGADAIDADLIERRRLEAEADTARRQLEQERKKGEEERKKGEEEREKDEGKGEGGKDKDD